MATFMPDDTPRPRPGLDDGPFWEAARDHRLVFQQCASCGTFRHPPLPVCWKCHSHDVEWVQSRGAGTVFTYTVIHRAAHVALSDRVPYPIVVVELADVDGLRVLGNLVNWASEGVRIGQPVEVVWDDFSDVTIPQFAATEGP
jgi:uncharacterized OB-fold protein